MGGWVGGWEKDLPCWHRGGEGWVVGRREGWSTRNECRRELFEPLLWWVVGGWVGGWVEEKEAF